MKITITKRKDQWLVNQTVFSELSEACSFAESLGATEVLIRFTPFMMRGFVVGSPMYEKVSA